MVGVVDYGMGNLLSVVNALAVLGADVSVCRQPDQLSQCDRLVLPGVGAFGDCMQNLRKSGMADALDQIVRREGRPMLGICLGMQALAGSGEERGSHAGLGWIDAEVVPISRDDLKLRVPHMGWNDISVRAESPLFHGLPESPEFYFVHSFVVRCHDKSVVAAECDYGTTFTAAVVKDNVAATQFHPEKSQYCGLKVLSNFLSWKP
jgi:glutamine amidotransferase